MENDKTLSIIIPALNEAANLEPLLLRIHQALTDTTYEVIIVDDKSSDNTEEIALSLSQTYPVRFYKKQGNRGKAYSILEGCSYAKSEIIAFIDADLQYPPEALPEMLEKIKDGADIVIAKRTEQTTSSLRRLTSWGFSYVFGRLLHGIKHDVQSGLKMFRLEVIRRFEVNPTPWTFDLEFLLKAKHAGYKIRSIPIRFSERHKGKTKVNVLAATAEIGISAIKMKFKNFGLIPFLPEMEEREGKGFHYKGEKFVHHSHLHASEMAFFRLNGFQNILVLLFCVLLISAFLLNWHLTLLYLLIALSLLYFLDIFFNFFLISKSFSKYPEIKITKEEMGETDDWDLPTYTIFCPLYKEWQVIPQFITAMSRLDYPKEKLQVLLLLEEDDEETRTKIKEFDLPYYFSVVVVPDSLPKTKPKACNFGLLQATGEYSVIYDAEDIPEKDQLKKAVLAFRKSGENVVCVQAKLNFYNTHHNVLTRLFTAEYSLWFDLVLTGLQSIQAPIPLGGTSNHFRTSDLKKLRGWDAFNVTEDCDLGMRLVKQGYKTAIFDSTTHEEANSSLTNWFGQRSRWIKGYIQSYFVHMRKPGAFSKDLKNPHLFSFQLIVGGKVLSMLINPLFWVMTISYFAFRPTLGPFIESLFPGPILYVGVFSAVVGNFLYFYYYMVGCAKRRYYDLIKFGFLIPLYWLMMSFATWVAIYKILLEPHYWFKTKHGLHLSSQRAMNQAQNVVGDNLVDNKFAENFAVSLTS